MAYIGKGLNDIATANISVDTMTGDGSDTTLALSAGTRGIGSINDVSVFISGIQQRPNIDYTLSAGIVTFTTAPVTGQAVCAISHSDSWQDNVADSSVVTESFADLAVTDAKIIGLNSSKLTGAMPAISGASLTGITETTNSASDPAIDTNGTLGDIWVNTTSGEMYILTDATTDENVWTNVGAGTGDVAPWGFPGTISGYTAGGYTPHTDRIDKFSLVSDADATDVGNISVARRQPAGQSSDTHGYTSGGYPYTNTIEKHSFTVDGDATDVANLTVARFAVVGASSETHGYTAGGVPVTNTIDKFTFSADADATDVGDLTATRYECAGQNSTTHGYTSGTQSSGNIIEKYSFTVDGNSTDVGDLTVGRTHCMGQSSATHGYTSGSNSSTRNIIDKFTFSSDANATDVGDLFLGRSAATSQSSTTHGYTSGGWVAAGNSISDIIDKFSFTTDGNSTDVANLSLARGFTSGTQH